MISYDSVKDIIEECDCMCSDSELYDRIDTYELRKELRDGIDKLRQEFSSEVYNEKAIAELKERVELVALRMESVLARVSDKPEYKKRYFLRAKVIKKYGELKISLADAYAKNDSKLASEILSWLHTVKEIANVINHIKFELNKEDMEVLELIGVKL